MTKPRLMLSSERRTDRPTKTRSNGHRTSKKGEPAWDLALLYPNQGDWSEEAYLEVANSTNRMYELVDGCIETLPMPDLLHQLLAQYYFKALDSFVTEHDAGIAIMAPSPVRLWKDHLREPDVFLLKSILDLHKPPDGALLVMEVVSPGKKNRERDLKTKPSDYAKAKIAEYWIIDPKEWTVTVLRLAGKKYKLHGKFKIGEIATSAVLDGFALDVAALFAAGEGKKKS